MNIEHRIPINLDLITTDSQLVQVSKWLEGKTLSQIKETIRESDPLSRVITKGNVGYVIEEGFFCL